MRLNVIAGVGDIIRDAVQWAIDKVVEFFMAIWEAFIDVLKFLFEWAFGLFVDFCIAMLDFIAQGIDLIVINFPVGFNPADIDYVVSVSNHYFPVAEGFMLITFLFTIKISVFALRIILKAIPAIW